MPTAIKIIILVVVLLVVLLLFYYVIPDISGTTPAQRKAGVQPYQLAQQGEAKKPGVDIGRLVGGILQMLKAAADFVVKSVRKGAGKATGKSDPDVVVNEQKMYDLRNDLNFNVNTGGYSDNSYQGSDFNFGGLGSWFGGGDNSAPQTPKSGYGTGDYMTPDEVAAYGYGPTNG